MLSDELKGELMNPVVVGNIICFAGSIIMMLMGLIKEKRSFLSVQCGMNAVFVVGNYVLGGISGSIANAVTMLRNLFCLKYKMGLWSKLFFIILQLGLTFSAGCDNIIMWLPIIGACIFTWFMDSENMVLLKIIIIASQLMWAVFDFSISNFATLPFDIAASVTNSVSLAVILKDRKADSKAQ